jgi:hypothetical protein
MRKIAVLWLGVSLWLVGAARAQQAAPVPQDIDTYVWADACKSCHTAIYDAWSKTKHAKAFDHLGRDERQAGSKCAVCHLTAAKDPITVGDRVVNAAVQCEMCHGAGKAHVEAAQAGNAAAAKLVKAPAERTCVACHNDTSPHYRGFVYVALKGLVHKQ